MKLRSSDVPVPVNLSRYAPNFRRLMRSEDSMSIHHEAMRHLDKAKKLLAKGDDDELRYAALELRYSIEHLYYKFIPSFKKELPDDVLEGKAWRPADIIDMISDLEPTIASDTILSIGPEKAPGIPGEQKYVLGKQSGIGKDLIRKAYHALGSYLHARVDQEVHDPQRLRRRLEKIVPMLERYRGDRVISSGFGVKSNMPCTYCGRTIVKRLQPEKPESIIQCPNRNCQALYKVANDSANGALWTPIEQAISCQTCKTDNWFPVHELQTGVSQRATFECVKCKTKYRLEPFINVVPVAEENHSSA